MEWISVKDRLPDDEVFVIALESDGEVYKLQVSINDDGVFWSSERGYFYHEVTHWMPLPEAPKDV